MATPYDRSHGAVGDEVPHPTTTETTNTTAPRESTAAKAGAAAKGTYAASENFRQGINNFFDNTIQPSASRDSAAHGETRKERPPEQHGNLYTKATTGPDDPANPSGNAANPTSHAAGGMSGHPETMGPGATATGTSGSANPSGPHATSHTGSSGFSADAEKLGKDVMGMIKDHRNKRA